MGDNCEKRSRRIKYWHQFWQNQTTKKEPLKIVCQKVEMKAMKALEEKNLNNSKINDIMHKNFRMQKYLKNGNLNNNWGRTTGL